MPVLRARAGASPGRQRLAQVGLGLGLALVAWLAQLLGAFEPLDRRLLDLYFLVRGGRPPVAPVVIVDIDLESLQRIEHRWPWPRSVHARLLDELVAAGASVVAFDILFLDSDPAGDRELARAAQAAPAVVWASTFATAGDARFRVVEHRGPVAALRTPGSAFGFVDLLFDPDGYVRRMAPERELGAEVFDGFATLVAERYRSAAPGVTARGEERADPAGGEIPTDPDGSLLVDFAGPPGTFPTLPYVRVLERQIPAEALRGKIVLVGATGFDTDRFFTPYYSRWLPQTRQPMAGVEIHANAIDALLRGAFPRRAGPADSLALLLLAGLAASLLVGQRRTWLALGALLAGELAFLAAGYLCFVAAQRWLPVAGALVTTPLLWGAIAFQRFLATRREKDFVRGTLERYVSPEVVREVVARGLEPTLGGARKAISVLFSDIRGFTGLSERLPPEALVELLNRHFTAASEIVLRHGGTLDKFIGDAVMAFWGAPIPCEDHALRAVRAALEMQAAAREIDAWARQRFGETLRIGIGIHSGAAVVGHFGSPTRLGYTAVGDSVNLAARVAAMTREREADVLVSHDTWRLVRDRVEAEALGTAPVRGRAEPVALYRVLGLRPGASPAAH